MESELTVLSRRRVSSVVVNIRQATEYQPMSTNHATIERSQPGGGCLLGNNQLTLGTPKDQRRFRTGFSLLLFILAAPCSTTRRFLGHNVLWLNSGAGIGPILIHCTKWWHDNLKTLRARQFAAIRPLANCLTASPCGAFFDHQRFLYRGESLVRRCRCGSEMRLSEGALVTNPSAF